MDNNDDSGGEAVVAPPPPSSSATTSRGTKKPRKRNKEAATDTSGTAGGTGAGSGAQSQQQQQQQQPRKKPRKQARRSSSADDNNANNNNNSNNNSNQLSAAQQAVNEQMRRVLEEDQYSANGSIVLDTDSEEEDNTYLYRGGQVVRLDKTALQQAVRKYNLLGRSMMNPSAALSLHQHPHDYDDDEEGDEEDRVLVAAEPTSSSSSRRKQQGKKNKKKELAVIQELARTKDIAPSDPLALDVLEEDLDRDGGSIFGQTTGASNSTWVECDKCKKWRRLRGLVDEKKLPSKWYCSMNKNDPERARCSAPEEEYETPTTPESAADARARKHFRVWVRRLQCQEAYEARLPAMTRGKKRAVASTSKDPYEWVRCCNPSCGKWRALLRIMDSKTNVIDRTVDGEWYCVMNTWDEKMASCAAPQENLPATGCPPWIVQDDE